MVALKEKDISGVLLPNTRSLNPTTAFVKAKRTTYFVFLLLGVTYGLLRSSGVSRLGISGISKPKCGINRIQVLNEGLSKNVSTCPGYEVWDVKKSKHNIKLYLSLAGRRCDTFGTDIKNLTVEVEYESQQRLHVHIKDSLEEQYQLPEGLWPRPSPMYSTNSDLSFEYSSSPFAFWISRASTSEVIFDTRISSLKAYPDPIIVEGKDTNGTEMTTFPLVFEDQYLQIATSVPEDTNIYGLGEVAASSGFRRNSSNSLSTMYASDAGTPEDDSLYGSFPFYLETRWNKSESRSYSHGVFLLNSHGMDVLQRSGVIEYRALGGTLDFYFLSGPNPKAVVEQFSLVTGKPMLLPYWVFGFHLCRWGWGSVEETEGVVSTMRKAGIPLETIWNDIDYMKEYRDFETDVNFSHKNYKKFLKRLHKHHQHYVPIVDAAIAVTRNSSDVYDTFSKGTELDVWIKNPDGETYVGRVWPGYTVFPDWTAKNIKEFWLEAFENMSRIIDFDGIWLDMNEPASFCEGSCGSNITSDELNHPSKLPWEKRRLRRSVISKGDVPSYTIHNVNGPLGAHTVAPNATDSTGVSHLETHNIWGYSEEVVTNAVLRELRPGVRPFILSRSTFSGSGRVSAHWLGDNYSTWKSMKDSIQGVLQFQMFQIPMVGPDTCGFSGNTTEELCIRWTQLSSFYPFMRNHNEIHAISQEPYRWDSVAKVSKAVLAMRYALLPYWVTLFAEAHRSGTPPLRSLHMEFDDPRFFGIDAQFMVGDSLLVTPVLEKGATKVTGFFPSTGRTLWRDWTTHEILDNSASEEVTIKVPLRSTAVHQRSGTVILTHTTPAYTLKETRDGSFSLVVFLDSEGIAWGNAILDDGLSLPVTEQSELTFAAANEVLEISRTGNFHISSRLSDVIILGSTASASAFRINGAVVDTVQEDRQSDKVSISNLKLDLNEDITVTWK